MFKANKVENELREKIIKLAILKRHKEYIHGCHGPEEFDCAGFVWYVYNEVLGLDIYEDGYGLSTTTKIMTSKYGKITLFDEGNIHQNLSLVKKGDILFFHRQAKDEKYPKEDNKYPGHCGIYLGDNKFIHCTRKKEKVIINNFEKSEYWNKVLVASKDIISYTRK